LTCRHPKAADDDEQDAFYDHLPFCDVADVLRFVNQECQFLSALTPLQPRYAKQIADENSLLAVIAAQAMNHGNFSMSRTSDIAYQVLEPTHQQYLRLATLQQPTTASTTPSPSCRFFRIAHSTWRRCTPASTARSSPSRGPP